MTAITLEYDRGTLLLSGSAPRLEEITSIHPLCKFDSRVEKLRLPAYCYRQLILALRNRNLSYIDQARAYEEHALPLQLQREPFPHQLDAVEEWWNQGQQGVVVLPTGSGKTFVAQLIMQKVSRSSFIVTPTLDLMHQWYSLLGASFDTKVGLLGGGEYDIQPVTVSTYDSAFLHMERIGNRFGLLIFDECHHLPGPSYSLAAEMAMAPFRLGLTATPERADGGERLYESLIGPIVYRREIKELAGDYLSDYETILLRVQLSDNERTEYDQEREIYRTFLKQNHISFSRPGGWGEFLAKSSRSSEGRRAFQAYRRQKEIAQASGAKLRLLEKLLHRHRFDRVLIFTNDNKTVYAISREFLIPAITHQTKVKERARLLAGLNEGDFPFLVTSKVLNEGVDIPKANVAIVLSGSGSVREHVQRLGRILRRGENKEALLYEVITDETAEAWVSQRRTQHSAYQ